MNIIYRKSVYIGGGSIRSGVFWALTKSVFTDAYAKFLALLVETRKGLGVTQVELAKRLGKPQPFISYLERGERRIDVIEFIAIARALGLEPRALFDDLMKRMPPKIVI